MEHDIKAAFGEIRAEKELKAKTIQYLKSESYRRSGGKRRKKSPARMAFNMLANGVFALLLVFLGWTAHGMYFSSSSYIDVDLNPAVELSVNRFDRIVGVSAYNDDGARLVANLKLMNKDCEKALEQLLSAMDLTGEDEQLLSITVHSMDEASEKTLFGRVSESADAVLKRCGYEGKADIFTVGHEVKSISHGYDISPAKYLAIEKLQETDPTLTVKGCRSHSIRELYSMAESAEEDAPALEDNGALENDQQADEIPEEPAYWAENESVNSGMHGNMHGYKHRYRG